MNMAQIKLIARAVAEQCIWNNTDLEDLHSGITPSSKKGDYSDVYVVMSLWTDRMEKAF